MSFFHEGKISFPKDSYKGKFRNGGEYAELGYFLPISKNSGVSPCWSDPRVPIVTL
jgi:hypothetical protein